MNKRLWLILGYMAFIFCVIVALFHYAKDHPLEDVRVQQKQGWVSYGNASASRDSK